MILKQFKNVEDEPAIMAKARNLGQAIRNKLDERR
jgi:hypothetical protein